MNILTYLGYKEKMGLTLRLFNDDLNLQDVIYHLHFVKEGLKKHGKLNEHSIQLLEDIEELVAILLESHRVTYETLKQIIKEKQLDIICIQ